MATITYTSLPITTGGRISASSVSITSNVYTEQRFGISNNFLPSTILNSSINLNSGVNVNTSAQLNTSKIYDTNSLPQLSKSIEIVSSIVIGSSQTKYQTYFDTLILGQAPYGLSNIINNNTVHVTVDKPTSYVTVYGTGTDLTLNVQKTFYCSTKLGETSYAFNVPVPVDRIDAYGFTVGKSAAAYQRDVSSGLYTNLNLQYPTTFCATYISATDLSTFLPPYVTSYNYTAATKGVLLNYAVNKTPAKVLIRVLDYYSLNLLRAIEYVTNNLNNTIHLPVPNGKYIVRIDTLTQ